MSQEGLSVPPQRAEDGGPFSMRRTEAPDWESLSERGMPPAPAPTIM